MLRYAVAAANVLLLSELLLKYTVLPQPYDDGAAIKVHPSILDYLTIVDRAPSFPPPSSGRPDDRLARATRLFEGQVEGSESVATLKDGTLLTLDKYGWVWTAPRGATEKTRAERRTYIGPGRPLGFHAVKDNLYIACSLKGLLRLQMKTGGKLEVLANVATDTNEPLNYVNDLDVAENGDVYFTSSTERAVSYDAKKGFYDTLRSYLMNLCKGDNSGRLLKYDSKTRETTTLMSGLWYANGVALSPDFKSVLVVETNLNRVHKYSLSSGTSEVLVDNIPAMPDGISRAEDGGYWVAGVIPLSPLPRLLAPLPRLRTLIAHLIGPLLPMLAKPAGIVLKYTANGVPSDALLDLSGARVSSVSAVAQDGNSLYLGNLNGDFVSRVEL